jgi:hypothetical protein
MASSLRLRAPGSGGGVQKTPGMPFHFRNSCMAVLYEAADSEPTGRKGGSSWVRMPPTDPFDNAIPLGLPSTRREDPLRFYSSDDPTARSAAPDPHRSESQSCSLWESGGVS